MNKKWAALILGLLILIGSNIITFKFFSNQADTVKGDRAFVLFKAVGDQQGQAKQYRTCLDNVNIEYNVDNDGNILVRQNDLDRASISCH